MALQNTSLEKKTPTLRWHPDCLGTNKLSRAKRVNAARDRGLRRAQGIAAHGNVLFEFCQGHLQNHDQRRSAPLHFLFLAFTADC